jgi:hypothetical protein
MMIQNQSANILSLIFHKGWRQKPNNWNQLIHLIWFFWSANPAKSKSLKCRLRLAIKMLLPQTMKNYSLWKFFHFNHACYFSPFFKTSINFWCSIPPDNKSFLYKIFYTTLQNNIKQFFIKTTIPTLKYLPGLLNNILAIRKKFTLKSTLQPLYNK